MNPDRAPGNSIYFFGEYETTNIIDVPTFTFAPSVISSITIHNSSDVHLYIGDIDVTALGSQPEVYLDSPNQGIVNDSSAFDFHIATSEAQPTLVDIEDDNPSQPTLELTNINNPIGQTIIKNTSGAVVDYGAIIRTNSLDVVAGGNVGAGPTYPVSVEMVQYQDDSGQNHEPLLNVSAGGNIDLDVRGRQRDGSADPVTINSEGIDAGGNILIDEEQGLEDGPATGSGGGVQVSATQQGQKGTYHSYYYPDNTAASPTAVDDGLYGNMNDTSNVLTIYDFSGRDANQHFVNPDGITAGGNVQIVPAPTALQPTIDVDATMNLNPVAGSSGTVSVITNGSINLWETVGAMRVDAIFSSNYQTITLASAGIIPLLGTGADLGHDIVLSSGSVIQSSGDVTLDVQNDFTMDPSALITSLASVTLDTDFLQMASNVGPGSTVDIAGVIDSPIEDINQDYLGNVPLNDTIGLTNVQVGTAATITMEPVPNGQTGVGNTINLGSLSPFNGGKLSAIAGSITVQGSGLDTLNLDDSGDNSVLDGERSAHDHRDRCDRPGDRHSDRCRLLGPGIAEPRARPRGPDDQRLIDGCQFPGTRRRHHLHDHHPGRGQHLERGEPRADDHWRRPGRHPGPLVIDGGGQPTRSDGHAELGRLGLDGRRVWRAHRLEP